MRAWLVVLAAVAITVPMAAPSPFASHAMAASEDEPADTDAWEPWFDEDLTVRVPLEVSLSQAYPDEWEGERLVAYELDLHKALEEAGWPMDRGQPVNFTLDEASLHVVPQGVDDPDPLPMITWRGALLSGETLGPTTTVAFLAEDDVDAYHVYVDREENENDHEPVPRDPIAEQKIMQLLTGPGSGHELIAPMQTTTAATVLVGSAHEASISVEYRSPNGWSEADCTQTIIAPDDWATCTVDTDGNIYAVRVLADKPVVAHAHNGAETHMSLASGSGTPEGTTLLAPHVRDSTTPISLIAMEESCQARVGPETVTVRPDTPTRTDIREHTTVSADCNVIGWISGRGPSMLASALSDELTKAGATSVDLSSQACGNQNVVAIGDERSSVVRVDTSEQEDAFRTLVRPGDATPRIAGHEALRGADWTGLDDDPGKGYTLLNEGNLAWTSLWDPLDGAMQMAPTPSGNIAWLAPQPQNCDRGTDFRLAVAPFQSEPRVQFATHGERLAPDTSASGSIPVSQTFNYAEDPGDGEIPRTGALVETALRGDLALTAAFVLVGDDAIPSTFAAHLHPVDVEAGTPDVIGPLFELELEPRAQLSGPGGVETFTLVGQGAFQSPTGEVTPLEINLNSEANTRTPGAQDAEQDLADIQAQLPMDEARQITTLTVTAPSEVPSETVTYELIVRGEPVDGGDAIPTRATLQIVPDRELSLTFEDGSDRTQLETEDGSTDETLVLTNEGTVEEDVQIALFASTGWEVTLTDDGTGETIGDTIEGLEPGESKTLDLDIHVPEDAVPIDDVIVEARSSQDPSVVSDIVATVLHGVDLQVDGALDPDLVTMEPGQSKEVNLTLANRGSEASVSIASDADEHMTLDVDAEHIALGPEGSPRANATVPINLTARGEAPIGTVVVGTIALEIRVSDLEPIEQLLSLRMRVVPVHDVDPVGTLEILPGLEIETRVDIQATGDADEDLGLSLHAAPQGWNVEHPDRFTVPHDETAPLELNITTPPQTEAGTSEIAFRGIPNDGTDPITFTIPILVPETPAFDLGLPTPLPFGIGATETYPLTIENRGNAPGDATVRTDAPSLEARPVPETVSLAPGESRTIDLHLTALEPGSETLTVTADPSAEHTLEVEAGHVDLGLELVSVTPDIPSEGESLRAVASLSNDGTVQARDVNVSLVSGDDVIKSETVARLNPGSSVALTLAVEDLPDIEDLRLVADPEGVYEAGTATDREASLTPDEAPGPAVVLLLTLVALAALFERRRAR